MTVVRKLLKERLDEELCLYFNDASEYPEDLYEQLLVRWSDDAVFSEKHRFDLLEKMIPDVRSKRILDMAAGCGSYVLQGLRNGWDTHGVEPSEWKHEIIDAKFEGNDYPAEWRDHVVRGVGEELPFPDESFDVFDSWQTIEHVRNERDCIRELYRVLKKGGRGVLRGPSYLSFYEGHYRLFWLPMMGSSKLARRYLKLRKRPPEGLDTFHPVNPYRIARYAREAGFRVVNIKRKQIYDAAKRRMSLMAGPLGWAGLPCIYFVWNALQGIRHFGKSEGVMSLLLIREE